MRRHLFSLIAALFAASGAVGQPPPRAAGVDVVPPTAFGFVTVRVSDLNQVDALKPVREALARLERADGGLERQFGVGLDEVDRVTVFAPGLSDLDTPIVVVTTRGPFNEAKVLKALNAVPYDAAGRRGARYGAAGRIGPAMKPPAAVAGEAVPPVLPGPGVPGGPVVPKAPGLGGPPPGGAPPPKGPGQDGAQVKDPPPAAKGEGGADRPAEKEPAPTDGPDLYAIEHGPYAALFLLDERTLVFLPGSRRNDPAGLLNLVGQLLRRRADGPLADALAEADKHTLVAAVRLSQVETALRGHEEFPRELVPFRSLLRARTATVTADVAAKTTVTARLTFADAAAARRAEPVLKTLMQLGVDALADLRKEAGTDPEWGKVFGPLMELASGALEKADVRTDGSAVLARLDAEVGPAVAQAVAALPDLTAASSARLKTQNNLKQIGLACHNFHDVNGHLPLDITDPAGRPLLSWRVLLLPYLEQDNLFRQLDLTKAWDDPRNAKLLEKMPDVFRAYGREGHEKGLTYLQMPMSPQPAPVVGPLLVPGRRLRLLDITDGTSNTIMVVEAAEGVNWAKPDDLRFDQVTLAKVGAPGRKWFNALFADGSVRTFRKDRLTDQQLKALMTINGGEIVSTDDK